MPDVNSTQLRDALAWLTNDQTKANAGEDIFGNPFVWFWEAIQGDFNDNRSTSQLVVDAAVSMIPLVDQVCDVRDLVANCRKLRENSADTWAWVALALTLIGLFPFLGSAVKGVLKVFFAFVRRSGGAQIGKAIDNAMTWVVTLLRREEVQRYLKLRNVDSIFSWLAKEIRKIHGMFNTPALLAAFDRGIAALKRLTTKVEDVPLVGRDAQRVLDTVITVRQQAQKKFDEVGRIVDDVVDKIVLRLEREAMLTRSGIVNVHNIHYRGALPEAAAVTLMRRAAPPPGWLSTGIRGRWRQAERVDNEEVLNSRVKDGWPKLEDYNVASFHRLAAVEIRGPARLFRVLSPNSRAMSDCWVSEKVFNQLMNASDPRAAWRKYLAVWPDWNVNGQFVVYDIKRGESLKAWQGPASSQTREELPGVHLEGGWEQIVFNIAREDPRNDAMRIYKNAGGGGPLREQITQSQFSAFSKSEKEQYTSVRDTINHPSISGPFETGWGYTDFGGDGFPEKIGLPALSGQTTKFGR